MASNSSHLDILSIGGTQSLLSLDHSIAWCLRCSGYVKGFYRFCDEALAYFVESSRVPAPSVDVYDTRATSQSCQGNRYGLMLPGAQCPLHQNRLLWARHGEVRDRGYQVARVGSLAFGCSAFYTPAKKAGGEICKFCRAKPYENFGKPSKGAHQ